MNIPLSQSGAYQVKPENHRNAISAERISERARIVGLSQSDIARELGITPQSVQQWFSGETVPRSTRLKRLAELLLTSGDYILGRVNSSAPEGNTTPYDDGKAKEIPLISWVQAGQWATAEDPYPVGAAEKMLRTFEDVGPQSFALKVHGDSMEPIFPDGCIIIVDPSREPRHGSYVIVRLERDAEVTFKQLVIDGPMRYLKPLNPRYPLMEIDHEAVICGVIAGMHRSF